MRISLFGAVSVYFVCTLVACAESPVTVAYSFSKEGQGGIASVQIEPITGRIETQNILFRDKSCAVPGKIRRSQDRQFLAVSNLTKNGPHVFLVRGADQTHESFELPAIPDEMRFTANQLLVSCEEDALGVITWAPAPELKLLELDKILSPAANGPEDVQIVPRDQVAVITCQKDSKGGKKKGHRVVLMQLPTLEVVADLELPRDHPELHIQDNNKESGPSPEIIFVSENSDTLAVTLDLYGAIGMMRWSAAKQDRLDDWTILSTSPQKSLGTAFPDRGLTLSFGNHEYLLVHNAGEEGGSCVVDLQKRRVVWQRPTPPGLEQSVYFPQLRRAFTVCSGKVKRRTADDVVKDTKPQTGLFHFDFRSQHAVRNAAVEKYPMELYATRIYAASTSPPLLLLAVGKVAEQPDILMTFDPVAMEIRDQQPAQGIVSQFER